MLLFPFPGGPKRNRLRPEETASPASSAAFGERTSPESAAATFSGPHRRHVRELPAQHRRISLQADRRRADVAANLEQPRRVLAALGRDPVMVTALARLPELLHRPVHANSLQHLTSQCRRHVKSLGDPFGGEPCLGEAPLHHQVGQDVRFAAPLPRSLAAPWARSGCPRGAEAASSGLCWKAALALELALAPPLVGLFAMMLLLEREVGVIQTKKLTACRFLT